jgi:two-component system probable response regulator PhcQ
MLNTHSNPVGILYIDDEEKALKYFRMAFGQKYKVFTAASGPEGLDILRKEADAIGIVISDQRMPGMQGAEVLGQVRNEFPQIVRLLTTAYSDLESAIQAVNKGHIYQYVVKPWEIPDLGMILQRAADYFLVTTERNGLLRLKMTTLQRIVCSDRLKSLLLAIRSWPEDRQAPVRRALGALVAALPADGSLLPSETAAFRPQDFEAGNLVLAGYQNGVRLLDALGDAVVDAGSLAARLERFGPAQAGSEGGIWTLAFAEGVDREGLVRTLFGALAEREVSVEAAGVFQALVHLAAGGGSLQILAGGSVVAAFDTSARPLSAEEIIAALFQRYSEWDIASR